MITLRVLILGGYGTFGGRLARLLADEPRLTLVVAGRSAKRAEAFCAALPARATLMPAVFDRDGDTDAQLVALAPDIVVDASGPFQGCARHSLSRSRGPVYALRDLFRNARHKHPKRKCSRYTADCSAKPTHHYRRRFRFCTTWKAR
jgi:hypothetical protein